MYTAWTALQSMHCSCCNAGCILCVIAMNKPDTKRDNGKARFPCEITKHEVPAVLGATQRDASWLQTICLTKLILATPTVHSSRNLSCLFLVINLQAPCVLYIGQASRYSPENAFYIFNQQIHFII